jgi:hypothetical protein
MDSYRADAVRMPPTRSARVARRCRQQEGVFHRLTQLAWLAVRSPSPPIQEQLASVQKCETPMQDPTSQHAG